LTNALQTVRRIPFDVGPIHFVGIGGIGMSGIAEVMLTLGYQVQGSDSKASSNTERLENAGARIFVGHSGENISGAGALVTSTAIKPDNPEVVAARSRGLPIVRRAEMLAELMRLKWTVAVGGTHGKTTTTSMVAALMEAGKLDPTVINGGIINAYGTNARLGAGEWMVVEADESDGTFTRLRATAAIVTNMDPEHLDHYGTVEAMNQGFRTFVENIPFYGFGVLCTDHPVVQAMAGQVLDRRIITYGFNPQSEVRGVNLRPGGDGTHFDLEIRPRTGGETRIEGLFLAVPGRHNVQNALAAITVARELGVTDDAIRAGLSGFGGVKRRFTTTGTWNGVRIVDDYGHHPVEIAAVLKTAREVVADGARVIAVVQPHRYTRLRDLFQEFSACFNDADVVAVADVYAAGESPIEGVNAHTLVARLLAAGHRRAMTLGAWDNLPDLVRSEAKPGDIVVCLGAGDITAHANALPGILNK
jgi:UDP-N-acetylmuramate--alanine ligase